MCFVPQDMAPNDRDDTRTVSFHHAFSSGLPTTGTLLWYPSPRPEILSPLRLVVDDTNKGIVISVVREMTGLLCEKYIKNALGSSH